MTAAVRTVEFTGQSLPREGWGALGEVVAEVARRHPEWFPVPAAELARIGPEQVTVLFADVVRAERPCLLSIGAQVLGESVHTVIGTRAPGEETHFLPHATEAALGLVEDPVGLAVAYEAMGDAELARRLVDELDDVPTDTDRVRPSWGSAEATSVTFNDRVALTVFGHLPPRPGPHPGLQMFLALDDVGFNHLATPHTRWKRDRYDLGSVHEFEPGAAGGWALALTSLRDLYAVGGLPGNAGADFGPEARRLGVMTARMHIGLDEAFGRRPGDVSRWIDEVEAAVRPIAPELLAQHEVAEMLAELRTTTVPCPAIRTHGDFHLGRVQRTDVGWFVYDFSPGGTPAFKAGSVVVEGAVYRSPLADVADMLWSFRHVADTAAAERDPTGRLGLADLARAWETRNRRAFLSGYLTTPGIGGIVPPLRDLARKLTSAFELEHTAARLAEVRSRGTAVARA